MTTGNSSQPASNQTPATSSATDDSTLDYKFYQRACELAGETASAESFEQGQTEGKFRFSEDNALLGALLSLYGLNIHIIAGEWTVFSAKSGQVTVFASTPLEAALTWVISQPLDLLTG